MNAEAFWHAVARRLDAGTPVFVALVVAHTRGSPGTRGARLLVDASDVVEGTVGGGIMEAQLIDDARCRLHRAAQEPPALERLVHRKKGTNHPSGLICAGEQTNLRMILEPRRDGDAVQCFCRAIENQATESATLMIDAGGLSIVQDGQQSVVLGMQLIDDDERWCYRESSVNPRRLAVVGGGHCGRALAHLAIQIGYWVEVFDSRAEVLGGVEWSDAVRRHALDDYNELGSWLTHPEATAVVVMTAAVGHDITSLASIASTELRWLGVMGSAAKIHEIRKKLKEQGIDRNRIEAIHGPIGLPMKSDTPAEIAVSIMGQLLAEWM